MLTLRSGFSGLEIRCLRSLDPSQHHLSNCEKWHSKSASFYNCRDVNHLNTGLVQYSNPYEASVVYYLYSNPLARFEVNFAYKLHLKRNKITSVYLFCDCYLRVMLRHNFISMKIRSVENLMISKIFYFSGFLVINIPYDKKKKFSKLMFLKWQPSHFPVMA